MKSKKQILVVAAHPDDEVLGCGGTIAKHAKRGDDVHVLIFAEGVISRGGKGVDAKAKAELQKLHASARRSAKILGVKSIELLSLPDNRMDSLDLLDIVKQAEKYVSAIQPNIVYTHHSGDLNVDHRLLHDAVLTSCRPLPSSSVEKILFFEVPSSTEWRPATSGDPFLPNVYVDISATLKLKLAALKEYASEMRPFPHARSLKAVESLAVWRGASAGVSAAECFSLGREIIRD